MTNHSSSDSDLRPRSNVSTRSKLIVLLLIVLIVSSGSVYYFDTPIFYYGYLAFSVLTIVCIIYVIIHFTYAPPELFASTDGKADDEKTSIGLENVLKAESRFKNRAKSNKKKTRTKKERYKGDKTERSSLKAETKLKDESSKTKGRSRKKNSHRIGSMPIEESIYEERVRLKSENTEHSEGKSSEIVTTYLCPECGGKELYYEAGLISGYKYHCKDCDYIGSLVIEKDFKIDD